MYVKVQRTLIYCNELLINKGDEGIVPSMTPPPNTHTWICQCFIMNVSLECPVVTRLLNVPFPNMMGHVDAWLI